MSQLLNHINIFFYEALYSDSCYLAAKLLIWVIQPKNKRQRNPKPS